MVLRLCSQLHGLDEWLRRQGQPPPPSIRLVPPDEDPITRPADCTPPPFPHFILPEMTLSQVPIVVDSSMGQVFPVAIEFVISIMGVTGCTFS